MKIYVSLYYIFYNKFIYYKIEGEEKIDEYNEL